MLPFESGGKVENQEPEKLLQKEMKPLPWLPSTRNVSSILDIPSLRKMTSRNIFPNTPCFGREFIQAESEIASINLLLGLQRPEQGLWLLPRAPESPWCKKESLICRKRTSGFNRQYFEKWTGLGGISPSQGDYFQATRAEGMEIIEWSYWPLPQSRKCMTWPACL